MPVYVDALIEYNSRPDLPFTRWCHMRADTLEELHAMAARIGLKREWFQASSPAWAPHNDLSERGRVLAVEEGAIELSRREWRAKFPKPRPQSFSG